MQAWGRFPTTHYWYRSGAVVVGQNVGVSAVGTGLGASSVMVGNPTTMEPQVPKTS
jgi:hypothetical protein